MTDTETDRTALLEQGRRKLKAFQDTRSGKAPSTTLRMPLATGTRPPGDGPDLRAVVTGLSRDKADIETERNELRARTIALEVESASLKERQAVDAATVKQLTHELSTSKSLLGEALQRNDTLIAKAQESLKGLEKAEIDKVELLALLRQREGPSVTFTQTKVSRFEETSSLPTSASSSLMELLPSLDDALDKRTDGVLQKRIQKLETQVTMLSRENNDLKIAAPPSHLALSTQMDDTDWKGKYETLLREKTGLAQDLESYISQESAFKDREARLLKEVAELKKSLQVTDSNDAHKKDSSPPLLEIDTGKVSGLKRELEEKDDEIEVLKTQLLHIQVTVEQLQNQIALLGDANAAMKKELEEERKITTLLSGKRSFC